MYELKYYKDYERDGHQVRLEIERNMEQGEVAPAPMEIGNFQEMTLHLNDGNEPIDAPIHKSSLTFSMVDAPDMPDTETTKYSGWEEFYTSDPKKYRVKFLEDNVTVWVGFITPDSWEGDLVYRNTLTITCRDNIGRLEEVPFTIIAPAVNNGMAKIYNVIENALYNAGVEFTYHLMGSMHTLTYQGQDLLEWAVDVSLLLEKNCKEVLEDLLSSLGLGLRFIPRKLACVMPLRDLATLANDEDEPVPVREPQFLNRTGHYSLQPGYKAVKEVASFEASEPAIDTFTEEDFRNGTISKDKWNNNAPLKRYTFGNVFNDEVGGKSKYVLLQYQSDYFFNYNDWAERTINVANRTKVNVAFELAHLYQEDGDTNAVIIPSTILYYRFKWLNGSLTYYWDFTNNQWVLSQKYAGSSIQGQTAQISLDITTPDTKGRLVFGFKVTELTYDEDNDPELGDYVRVGNFTVSVDESSFPKQANITTNYNEQNSLTLDRKTAYGQAPQWMLSAGSIGNAFYKYDPANYFPPIGEVMWNDKTVSLPVAVQVHMQLLALHAKANYQLTGDVRIKDSFDIPLGCIWEIYGRKFLLTAGNYNCLSGHINDAVLMEYDDWDDIFGSISADFKYNDDTYIASTGGNATSITATGGGGGGTGGGITLAQLTAYLNTNNYVHDLDADKIATALGYTPADAASVPTHVSQLENDMGYFTNQDTYTKGEVDGLLIAKAGIDTIPEVFVAHITAIALTGKITGTSYNDINAAHSAKKAILLEDHVNNRVYVMVSRYYGTYITSSSQRTDPTFFFICRDYEGVLRYYKISQYTSWNQGELNTIFKNGDIELVYNSSEDQLEANCSLRLTGEVAASNVPLKVNGNTSYQDIFDAVQSQRQVYLYYLGMCSSNVRERMDDNGVPCFEFTFLRPEVNPPQMWVTVRRLNENNQWSGGEFLLSGEEMGG